MLETDLKGLWMSIKNNQIFLLIILLGVCISLYMLLSYYMKSKNNFDNIVFPINTTNSCRTNVLYGADNLNGNAINNTHYCKGDIPRLDEDIIRNSIDLPNRDPSKLTSQMVYPTVQLPTDEALKQTRMDILNMFYNSFDDDATSINNRPQNLYIVP